MFIAPLLTRPLAASAVIALTLCSVGAASAASLTENFDTVLPSGWSVTNNSDPVGATDWFQGNPYVFEAHAGASDSYAAANFGSVDVYGSISTWLITPTLSFQNGDTLSFYTRTVSESVFPDSLEVRFSNVGGSDVGASADSVGTFQQLLLSINPGLAVYGYPENWTRYSVTISGLSGATDGAIAFRYLAEDGGLIGNNSNYIGIDTLEIAPVPEPGSWAMLLAGMGMLGALRARARR